MSSISSYNNDKMVMGEVEYPAMDPASGAFFQPDLKKNEDLKLMLDGSKDSLKLEAMKRIIGMIAKGRDASDLFPAVVKNVVSKNIEVKKLVYVYLVRYAEEQQDLALLSISTFQRALKDPNQLIRACALRVLSSIRVPMIVPIVTLAIRDAACDMSPYVRKTAAHAIPKLYSLDPEQKEDLVGLIARLLADRAPLVVGSAAGAYSEVCPHRIDIIHGSYRKLCGLLTDVDEWGQLTLLNVLTVYVRMCFPDPNTQQYSDSEPEKPFYHSDSSSSKPAARTLDADHRLLLRAAKSLLQSRNAGVVMAVAQLYVHCAPANELPPVAKALVRLLRAPVEVQSVVLKTIVCLTNTTPGLFEPFLKSFFVRNSDPTHIKLLKLEILTNLATETSAPVVLRELHAYLTANDKTFCAATVQAIGRLAAAIPTHTDTCLRALLKLLASKHESLVCESVVVIKRVVSLGPAGAAAAVSRAARLLPRGSLAPAARAAAVWLLAEHGAGDPKAASILASCATTFADQDELVKLQLLSLAVKVALTQPATLALCSYLFTLARYDASYDVRDRARLLRRFIEPKEGSQLAKCTDYVFKPNTKKPATHDTGKDRHQYTVGTLSQYIGSCANGYRALPPAPPTALPSTLRDANDEQPLNEQHKKTRDKTFYSDPDSNGSGSASESSSSETSGSEDEDGEEESDDEKEVKKTSKLPKETNNQRSSESDSGTSDSETDSSSESSSGSDGDDDDDDGSDEDDDNTPVKERNKADGDKKSNSTKPAEQKADKSSKSNLELLLELDEMATTLPTMTPTAGGLLSPLVGMPQLPDAITPVGPSFVQTSSTELLSRVVGGGLSIRMRFARAPHLYSSKLCSIEVVITNHLHDDVTDVKVAQKGGSGTLLHAFTPIAGLSPAASVTATLGVDFKDSLQPVEVTFSSSNGEVSVAIAPPVGELLRAVTMSEDRWDKEQRKLRGMTECDKKVSKLGAEDTICKTVLETANVTPITCTGDLLRFSGQLLSSQELVLVSVRRNEANDLVIANCANMAIASLLVNEVANALARNIH